MFCYAVERHFRGLEYNSLTLAVFVALRPLKTPRNRFLRCGSLPLKQRADMTAAFCGAYSFRCRYWISRYWIFRHRVIRRRKIQRKQIKIYQVKINQIRILSITHSFPILSPYPLTLRENGRAAGMEVKGNGKIACSRNLSRKRTHSYFCGSKRSKGVVE